jgi:hypothetical protein
MLAVVSHKELVKLAHEHSKVYMTTPSGEKFRVIAEGDSVYLYRENIILTHMMEITASSLPLEVISVEDSVPIGGTVW